MNITLYHDFIKYHFRSDQTSRSHSLPPDLSRSDHLLLSKDHMCDLLGTPHTPLLFAVSRTLATSAATLRRDITLLQLSCTSLPKQVLRRFSPMCTPVHSHALLDSAKNNVW